MCDLLQVLVLALFIGEPALVGFEFFAIKHVDPSAVGLAG
jgi:hypothetical protein